jgi:hypothetical protein
MLYISKYSKYLENVISVFKADSVFQLRKVGSFVSVRIAQSCVLIPISVEKLLNSSRLHPSGRHGNTSGCSSEFEKIPAFLCRHGLERHSASIQTTGQHHLDAKSLIRKISADILQPSRLQSNIVRMGSFIRQLRVDKLQLFGL